MASPRTTYALSRDFDAFLRFPLWRERDEAPLSVLSAFARLDLDPWREAADLARMPDDTAALRLASALGRLPGAGGKADLDTLCRRSVLLLRADAGEPTTRVAVTPEAGAGAATPVSMVVLVMWLSLLLLMTYAAAGRPSPAKPPTPAPAAAAAAAGAAR